VVGCPRPENPLSKRLDALGSCWLEVSGCCQVVYMPLPLLAKNHGGGLMLRDVLARLRCSKCGSKPVGARRKCHPSLQMTLPRGISGGCWG
jgi:hypothetical protein